MTPVVRICNYPGCTNLAPTFRCPEHNKRDGCTERAWYRFSWRGVVETHTFGVMHSACPARENVV